MLHLLRYASLFRGVLIVVVIALTVTAFHILIPHAVHAYSACDEAKKYGYNNVMWNFLCDMELLFEYYFSSGEV